MLWLLALHPSNLTPYLPKHVACPSHQPFLPQAGWPNVSVPGVQLLSLQGSHRQTEEKVTREDFLLRLLKKINPQIFSVTGSSKTTVARVLGQQLFVGSGGGCDRERTAHLYGSSGAFSTIGSWGSATSPPVRPKSQRQSHAVSLAHSWKEALGAVEGEQVS